MTFLVSSPLSCSVFSRPVRPRRYTPPWPLPSETFCRNSWVCGHWHTRSVPPRPSFLALVRAPSEFPSFRAAHDWSSRGKAAANSTSVFFGISFSLLHGASLLKFTIRLEHFVGLSRPRLFPIRPFPPPQELWVFPLNGSLFVVGGDCPPSSLSLPRFWPSFGPRTAGFPFFSQALHPQEPVLGLAVTLSWRGPFPQRSNWRRSSTRLFSPPAERPFFVNFPCSPRPVSPLASSQLGCRPSSSRPPATKRLARSRGRLSPPPSQNGIILVLPHFTSVPFCPRAPPIILFSFGIGHFPITKPFCASNKNVHYLSFPTLFAFFQRCAPSSLLLLRFVCRCFSLFAPELFPFCGVRWYLQWSACREFDYSVIPFLFHIRRAVPPSGPSSALHPQRP